MNTVPPKKQQVLTKDKEPQGDLRFVNLKRSVTVSVNSHKEEPARKKTKHDETTKEKFVPFNKIEWCSDTKTPHCKKDDHREENNIARTNNGKACKTASLIFDHGTEMRNSQPQTDRKCLPKGDLRFKLLRKQ